MRIVIDLQGAQAENRSRGIGRYSLSLALAITRNRGGHEVLIVLNGVFPESIEDIKSSFKGLLDDDAFYIWNGLIDIASVGEKNEWRRKSAELIREAFISNLKPDIVLISSFFEGLVDDSVANIKVENHFYPVVVILYDLIPFIHQQHYLKDPRVKNWYLNKIEALKVADALFSISESSYKEGVNFLNKSEDEIINISSDADPQFKIIDISKEFEVLIRKKYNLSRNIVMYTGGVDYRKNIEGLIRAYAQLPEAIRISHQLAIVCSCEKAARARLEDLAREYGLVDHELVFTGYIPESDLIALYNICKLFVFPSWHEGFGLPVLEAMRCGAAVIASDATSLPEVVGWSGALFEARSDESMKNAIEAALVDDSFHCALKENARKQSRMFSWDRSGVAAIRAMERLFDVNKNIFSAKLVNDHRKKLAYISPLPPSKTGIADYSSDLLPFLSKYYEIDVVLPAISCKDHSTNKHFSIKSVDWFKENSKNYERVLYHFGNSEFHAHMFDLIRSFPGVVVLHDFYLSGILAHLDVHGFDSSVWARELYHSHGYSAFAHRFRAKDTADVVWKYPVSLGVIEDSLGVIAHSESSLRLSREWYSDAKDSDWRVIPLLRNLNAKNSKKNARKKIGIPEDIFLICSFGILGPNKLNEKLLDAYLGSKLSKNQNCVLVFVGENSPGDYGDSLKSVISKAGLQIKITGWVNAEDYKLYLLSADIAIQLRTLSRGETSAAVLDCMNYGIPTIINANGSMFDIPSEGVLKLPDEFSRDELIQALERLYGDRLLRESIGKKARDLISKNHDPVKCAEQYTRAIEDFYKNLMFSPKDLIDSIGKFIPSNASNQELMGIAGAINKIYPPRNRVNQIFVDISELIVMDSRTGIQRVVRSILKEWLENPPSGYRIEPVYASSDQPGYKYARRYISDFLGCPNDLLEDREIEYFQGDIFVGLDLQPLVICAQEAFFQKLKIFGIKTVFIVYDLLPITLEGMFIEAAKHRHEEWMRIVSEADEAICISETVSNDVKKWIRANNPLRINKIQIKKFSLGADLENSIKTIGIPNDSRHLLGELASRASFLMVGTVEPRKGHKDVLDTFDEIWSAGKLNNLVIVGKQGWMVEGLIERIRSHKYYDKYLFWINDASDEYLQELYKICTCLIAASYGEGFGLPLIEAARFGVPIIARDIPIFREVMGSSVNYFGSDDRAKLINLIEKFESNRNKCLVKYADGFSWISWKQSSEELIQHVISKNLI